MDIQLRIVLDTLTTTIEGQLQCVILTHAMFLHVTYFFFSLPLRKKAKNKHFNVPDDINEQCHMLRAAHN